MGAQARFQLLLLRPMPLPEVPIPVSVRSAMVL